MTATRLCCIRFSTSSFKLLPVISWPDPVRPVFRCGFGLLRWGYVQLLCIASWFGTAAAVADTRNTTTTTASALSPPSSFRLRNSPIVSLSSWATFCKCRLALARCALFALSVHAGHLTGGFDLAESPRTSLCFWPVLPCIQHHFTRNRPYPTIQHHPIIRSTRRSPDGGRICRLCKHECGKVMLVRWYDGTTVFRVFFGQFADKGVSTLLGKCPLGFINWRFWSFLPSWKGVRYVRGELYFWILKRGVGGLSRGSGGDEVGNKSK